MSPYLLQSSLHSLVATYVQYRTADLGPFFLLWTEATPRHLTVGGRVATVLITHTHTQSHSSLPARAAHFHKECYMGLHGTIRTQTDTMRYKSFPNAHADRSVCVVSLSRAVRSFLPQMILYGVYWVSHFTVTFITTTGYCGEVLLVNVLFALHPWISYHALGAIEL